MPGILGICIVAAGDAPTESGKRTSASFATLLTPSTAAMATPLGINDVFGDVMPKPWYAPWGVAVVANIGEVVICNGESLVPANSFKSSPIRNGLSTTALFLMSEYGDPTGPGVLPLYGEAKMFALMIPGGFDASPSEASNMVRRMPLFGVAATVGARMVRPTSTAPLNFDTPPLAARCGGLFTCDGFKAKAFRVDAYFFEAPFFFILVGFMSAAASADRPAFSA